MIKEMVKYMQLLNYLKKSYPKTKLSMVQMQKLGELRRELMIEYPRFAKQSAYINDFSWYLANNIIGINECYTLFKNFIIEQYGKKCFKDYENYVIKDSYSKEQLKRFKEIFKINSNDIKKIIEKKQIQLYLAPIGYIFYGFSWRKTKEGFVFWSQINQEWISYIFSNIVNNKLIYNP